MTIEGDEVLGHHVGSEHRPRPWDDHRSDEELLAAWRSEADDDGRATTAIICRYRKSVREWLEAEGLTRHECEHVIGTVFLKAMDSDGDQPLADLLRGAAAEAVREYRGADG